MGDCGVLACGGAARREYLGRPCRPSGAPAPTEREDRPSAHVHRDRSETDSGLSGQGPEGCLEGGRGGTSPHGHVIGVSLCKVQSSGLHGDRWWLVARDGVGNTPLGPGGVPPFVALPWSLLILRISSRSIRSTSDFGRVHNLGPSARRLRAFTVRGYERTLIGTAQEWFAGIRGDGAGSAVPSMIHDARFWGAQADMVGTSLPESPARRDPHPIGRKLRAR